MIRVFLAFILFIALLGGTAATASDLYRFGRVDDQILRTTMERVVFKVYDTETDPQHNGSATVIDAENGLLVTAAHVIKDTDQPWISLPGIEQRFPVTIVDRLPIQADNDTGPRDIALLKSSETGLFGGFVEIRFARMDQAREHNLIGYGRDETALIFGKQAPSKQEPCIYSIRENTFKGDSGSPVVDQNGMLAGIILKNAELNSKGVILSLECADRFLLNAYEIAEPAATDFLRILRDAEHWTFRRYVQPPPANTAEWLSNLQLAELISNIIETIDQRPLFPNRARLVEITRVLSDRALKTELQIDLAIADAQSRSETPDAVLQTGEAFREEGLTDSAAATFQAAEEFYLQQAAPVVFASGSPFNPAGSGAARLLKAAADAATKRGEVTGDPAAYERATALGVAAAFHAPEGGLKSAAQVTAGVAAQRSGDLGTALAAFGAADQDNALPAYLRSSLADAVALYNNPDQFGAWAAKNFKIDPGRLDQTLFHAGIGRPDAGAVLTQGLDDNSVVQFTLDSEDLIRDALKSAPLM